MVIGWKQVIVGVCVFWCIAALWEHTGPVVHAQGSGPCNQTIAISVAAAASQVLATAVPGQIIYVCGGVISGDTIATTGQFKTGTTDLTGAMRMCDECAINFGDGNDIVFAGIAGSDLSISAVTGAITGFVRISSQ